MEIIQLFNKKKIISFMKIKQSDFETLKKQSDKWSENSVTVFGSPFLFWTLPMSKALNPRVTLPTGAATTHPRVGLLPDWKLITTTRCPSRLYSRPWEVPIVNSCREIFFFNKKKIIISQTECLSLLMPKLFPKRFDNVWQINGSKMLELVFKSPLAVNSGGRGGGGWRLLFLLNSPSLRCVEVVWAAPPDWQSVHNCSSKLHLRSRRRSNVAVLFSFFFPFSLFGSGWKQRGALEGGRLRGCADWQTFRSHASLVVIRNKHSEQGRKHIPPELGQIQASGGKRELGPFRLSNVNRATRQ